MRQRLLEQTCSALKLMFESLTTHANVEEMKRFSKMGANLLTILCRLSQQLASVIALLNDMFITPTSRFVCKQRTMLLAKVADDILSADPCYENFISR